MSLSCPFFLPPGRVDGLCDGRSVRLDRDGDVDLADFARLQTAFAER